MMPPISLFYSALAFSFFLSTWKLDCCRQVQLTPNLSAARLGTVASYHLRVSDYIGLTRSCRELIRLLYMQVTTSLQPLGL